MDYKMKLVEFLQYWNTYRKTQDQLTQARKDGNVALVTDCLTRINELRKEMDEETLWILNGMEAEQKKEKGVGA